MENEIPTVKHDINTRKSSYMKTQEAYRPSHGMAYPGEEGIPVLGPMVWSIRERRVSLS